MKMGFGKEAFCEGLGAVNIVLDDRVVLQGQIIRRCDEERKTPHFEPEVNDEFDNDFITLELSCDALLIRDNGQLQVISPTLFEEGDRVRINISEISAIGPRHGCPD